MSVFTMIGDMIAERRTRRDTLSLRKIAEGHFERLSGEQVVHGPEQVPYGELVIQSGVSEARERAARPFSSVIDELARQHGASHGEVVVHSRRLADLPAREHVVTVNGHHPSKVFHQSPDLGGDSVPTRAARTEHDRLDAKIATERAAGAVRHTNGVSTWWKVVAYFLMFVDVLALLMVMIPAENTSIDPANFTGPDAVMHVSRMITALSLSLLGAGVLALLAHTVGDLTWARAHRARVRAEESGPVSTERHTGLLRKVVADPALVTGWAALLLVSLVTGGTMYFRLSHSVSMAVESIGSSTGTAIAVMIAIMATAGPICVAVVSALAPSPEVLRRNALGAILAKVEREEVAARERIDAAQVAIANTLKEADRTLWEAEREVKKAGAPAAQMILEMRSKYGYAGDLHSAIGSVDSSEDTTVFDTDPLSRPRAVIEAMRSDFAIGDREVRAPRRTHRDATGTGTSAPVEGEEGHTSAPESEPEPETVDEPAPAATDYLSANGSDVDGSAVEFQTVIR